MLNTVTWVMILGNAWAIGGFATKDDCLEAAKDTRLMWTTPMCVRVPAHGRVYGGRD